MELLMGSLHLEERRCFASMVQSESVTASELYCLAKGLDEKGFASNQVIFHFKSPAAVHGAASRLFYSLRLAACGAFLHAARTGDLDLQNQLDSPRMMACCSTWTGLAHIQKETRKYEDKIEEGLQPAEVSRSSGNCGLPDEFKMINPASRISVTVSRTMLRSCSMICHTEISRMTERVLGCLQGTVLCIKVEGQGFCDLDLADVSNYRSLVDAVLLTLPEYADIGKQRMNAVSMSDQERRNAASQSNGGEQTSASRSDEHDRLVYWSTLSCTYYGKLLDGRCFSVSSDEISRKLEVALDSDDKLTVFLDSHAKIPVILAVMMLYMLRGSARETEILRLRTGVTNLFFAKEMMADVRPSLRPGTELTCELLV
jgi:hypothetical protein